MSEIQVTDAAQEYLGDANDPRSFRNLLPRHFVSAALRIPENILSLSDKQLKNKIPKEGRVNINRLRHALWFALYHAQRVGRKVTMREIYWEITSQARLVTHLDDPYKCALILRPPVSYELSLHEALHESVEQVRDILEADHYDDDGKLDPKIADVKRRLFENLSDRVKGMPVQRTENLNVNKDVARGESVSEALPSNPDDIDKRLAQLEKEMSGPGATPEPDIKDVTPDG